jgi:hypothetical protein
MAQKCRAWIRNMKAGWPGTLVFEWPQIYRAGKSIGDPNNLTPLVGVGMALAGLLCAPGVEVVTVKPGEWTRAAGEKSTKAADFETATRTKRIRARLNAAELACLEGVTSHDAFDAIGIGLYYLGRLEPIRVLSGAVD